MITLPITNGFYKADSLPVSAQQAINCFTIPCQVPSLVPEYVVGIPGLSEVANLGILRRADRGAHVMDDVAYFVNGNNLFRLNSDFTADNIGVISGSGGVSMADNGTQLCILVPDGDGYIYNRTTETIVTITDANFRANGNPQYVEYVDGYFVFTTDEKKFIVSDLNDGTAYNALDFWSAEADPDKVVAPIVYRNQLFITGQTTIEGFTNQGGSGFPFTRSGLFFDKGVFSPLSLVKTQDAFMFIGGGVNETPSVWAVAGNAVQKISTNAIDSLLSDLTNDELQEVYAWAYAQNGSFHVGFALADTTIVYEMTTQKWHERRSYIDGENGPYRVRSMITAYGGVLCSDTVDGRIGRLSLDVYTEYGNNIIHQITTQPFAQQGMSMFVPHLELTVESGVGNSDDANPVIVMERSADGRTWGAPRPKAIGKIGRFDQRAIWNRNGRVSRFESFRFTHSDKTKFAVIQLDADIRIGAK